MKPGPRDKKYRILITGRELQELKELTFAMAEAFGLDDRIERYQGKRPMGFYLWDLDCLDDVLSVAVDELREKLGGASPRYKVLANLFKRIEAVRAKAYQEMDEEGT